MSYKSVIWVVGSNGTGKTTLSKNLHYLLSGNSNPESIVIKEGKTVMASTSVYGLTAHVGMIKPGVQCSGTDSLKTKKEIETSLDLAFEKGGGIAIIDGIMSTSIWSEMFLKRVKDIFMIELYFENDEDHKRRVAIRRAIKQNLELTEKNIQMVLSNFQEKTIENILRKRKIFFNQTRNVANVVKTCVHIEASKSEAEVAQIAYNSFIEHIKL